MLRTGSRSSRTGSIWWLAITFFAGIALAMAAEVLVQHAQDNRLHFSAPTTHFLTGRPLERLRYGAPVPFDMQVTVWSGDHNNIFRRSAARFIVSYDVIEQRYAVTKFVPQKQGPSLTKSVRNINAAQAEAWCLEEMAVDMAGVTSNRPLWTRMEIRGDEEHDSKLFGHGVPESGISLNTLIEKLSRPPQSPAHWTLEAGPLTWEQLRRGG